MNSLFYVFIAICIFITVAARLLGEKMLEEREIHNAWRKFTRYMIVNRSYQLAMTIEMIDDGVAIRKWVENHEHGAITEEDHEEWCSLIMNQIGSYMLFCESHGFPIDTEHIDHLWEKVESWRIP